MSTLKQHSWEFFLSVHSKCKLQWNAVKLSNNAAGVYNRFHQTKTDYVQSARTKLAAKSGR